MLSVAIMHTPSCPARAANVRALTAQLPEAAVIEDAGRGVWDTARRAWLRRGTRRNGWPLDHTTHHLVLQDDVTLCDGFLDRALDVIAQRPFVPLSLFTSNCRGLTAQALVLPVAMISSWLAWCEENDARLPAHDDVRLRAWMKSQGLAMSFARPSLVQHGAFESLLGHEVLSASTFEQCPQRVEVFL